MQADRLLADLNAIAPDASVLAVPAVGDACAPGAVPVVRMALRSRVLFATNSDEPLPEGGPMLDRVAALIRRDTPTWQVTILGHTDDVGSDAYNIDLSRRRAAKVLRALADRDLDPAQLSAIAIGKRQPIADNRTEAGRAMNRRVEFLLSRCLGANLGLVQQTGGQGLPVQVMRLDPAFQLATVGSVTLRQVSPAPVAAAAPLSPPPAVVRPAPAPRYQPNSLSPAVQPNPLGGPVPY